MPSESVRPFRIKESLVHFECTVSQIIPLGAHVGAGHLIICQVQLIHLNPEILDDDNKINPHKIDLMGRLGQTYYSRASGESVYSIYRSARKTCIGFEHLPESAKSSHVLTANNLGRLAAMANAPTEHEIEEVQKIDRVRAIQNGKDPIKMLHKAARTELDKENLNFAAKLIWLAEALVQQDK